MKDVRDFAQRNCSEAYVAQSLVDWKLVVFSNLKSLIQLATNLKDVSDAAQRRAVGSAHRRPLSPAPTHDPVHRLAAPCPAPGTEHTHPALGHHRITRIRS